VQQTGVPLREYAVKMIRHHKVCLVQYRRY